MDWGTIGVWVGAFAGGGLGLIGGVIGTYFTIKNTHGPRERAFTIKGAILGWIFIAGLVLIPSEYKFLVFIAYAVILLVGIRKWNEMQFRIRKEESGAGA